MTFPRTLLEFEKQFSSDEACRAYLEKVRWPDGFICPQCSKKKAWQTARGTHFCQICHRQSSVTAGTVFHHTQLPLSVWFGAIWLMVGDKGGISCLGCKRQLGLKRYETAWRLLQKLRLASVRPDRILILILFFSLDWVVSPISRWGRGVRCHADQPFHQTSGVVSSLIYNILMWFILTKTDFASHV